MRCEPQLEANEEIRERKRHLHFAFTFLFTDEKMHFENEGKIDSACGNVRIPGHEYKNTRIQSAAKTASRRGMSAQWIVLSLERGSNSGYKTMLATTNFNATNATVDVKAGVNHLT